MEENDHEDEQARRERANQLREAIQEIQGGRSSGPPRTPREFTEERAREAAAEERRPLGGASGDEDEDEDD
jgi:hypothetical protein